MGVVPVSPNSRAWLDHWKISGFLTAADFQMDNELIDKGNFESSGPRMMVANYSHRHSHTVLWSNGAASGGATDDMDAILHGLAGSSDGEHYLGETRGVVGAMGDFVMESVVKLASKPHRGQNGQLQGVNLELAAGGPLSRSRMLTNTTASATGTYTSQSQTTYAAGSPYQAVVRVPQVAGTSWSITVDIEGSSDGAAWATMAGLTVTRTTPGVTRVTTTGEIKAFVRGRVSAITLSTGTTAIPVLVTAGAVVI